VEKFTHCSKSTERGLLWLPLLLGSIFNKFGGGHGHLIPEYFELLFTQEVAMVLLLAISLLYPELINGGIHVFDRWFVLTIVSFRVLLGSLI
jgi:hypothetical protein